MKFTLIGELWGNVISPTNHSGMIGMIYHGQGDIGMANCFISLERSLYVQATFPFLQEVQVQLKLLACLLYLYVISNYFYRFEKFLIFSFKTIRKP